MAKPNKALIKIYLRMLLEAKMREQAAKAPLATKVIQ